jgi:hypothetical protein
VAVFAPVLGIFLSSDEASKVPDGFPSFTDDEIIATAPKTISYGGHPRFILKAITPLFNGEPNSKGYRIGLDMIACLPKKLMSEGMSLESQPPISELILKYSILLMITYRKRNY